MKILLILLMAFCLVASAQVVSGAEKIQSVGGDFGRAWLDNYQSQNPNPTAQDSEDNLSSWGGAPGSVASNMCGMTVGAAVL